MLRSKYIIGFFIVLGIVLSCLKLFGIIDWNWVIVLSPIWGAILVCFVLVFFLIRFIYSQVRED